MLHPVADPPTGWLEATWFCGAGAYGAWAGGIAAVETGAGGASGVEATLDVGAAAGRGVGGERIGEWIGRRRVGLGRNDPNPAEQPASQTPINPVKATRTALRRTKNAANSLIGPTHPYATQLLRQFRSNVLRLGLR